MTHMEANMIGGTFPIEHLHLLSAVAERVFPNGSNIVRTMASTEMATADGLEFASIDCKLVPADVVAFLRHVELVAGCLIEIELLRVIGFVPPHHHERCSAAIIRCDTKPNATVEGLFFTERNQNRWNQVEVGRVIEIPAGMVHAIRVDRAVNFISVNAPPLDPRDVISDETF